MKKVIAESLARVHTHTHTHTHTVCLLNKGIIDNQIIYRYKKIVVKA